ncbi:MULTISPECIES: 5S rRNA E-loop-binding protein [Lachnospiraceae]|uniref:50S ribosomal protein L25/general stress protein Ctc n=1 Tax=Faecalicatena acetigenes TaxID=2981790 RepID=A0ABT2TCU6_9FIRM|nr:MULTISPECIES: 5S rRNA E-loop-binding protein [Lachnospiraceae]MCU6748093.1 50S ribosomal protein L25/general stress protein Ctc [Faecalicatena acetigenes]SCI26065.1 50S ribosomal protein L25 [uncultured Clostridium sp.]
MENIYVQKRDFTVKAKKMRQIGMVPGSVFGKSLPESISIQIDERTARRLIRNKREGSKLKLDLDGQIIPVQIKEKTINTLNNEILHISFQALKVDEKVNSVIHIILKNTEKITEMLESMLLEIPYSSFPEDMIDTITVDVDGMSVGTVITVDDIPELMNEKIDLQVDKKDIILRISDKKYTVKKDAEQKVTNA